MSTTITKQDELEAALNVFAKATQEHYGSHSYLAGFLQSMLVSALSSMPKRKQQEIIDSVVKATVRTLEARVMEKVR